MLMAAVDLYVAVRRAAGFQLKPSESYLRSFARFAMERGDRHVVAQMAIDWATTAAICSPSRPIWGTPRSKAHTGTWEAHLN
jgi:integrase/recombinase XerD